MEDFIEDSDLAVLVAIRVSIFILLALICKAPYPILYLLLYILTGSPFFSALTVVICLATLIIAIWIFILQSLKIWG